MKKLFLSLLIVSSVVIFAAQHRDQNEGAFQITEQYFSSGQYEKDCPYDGYTWQEVEAVVDKIIAVQKEPRCQLQVQYDLNDMGRGDWQVALACDSLTKKEWRLLIIAIKACENLVKEKTTDDDIKEFCDNAELWMKQGMICALIEIAAGNSLELLTEDAHDICDEYHEKYSLRWLPLLIANVGEIQIWDYEKVGTLTREQVKIVHFPTKIAKLYKQACSLGANKELENAFWHMWFDLTDVWFDLYDDKNEGIPVNQIKFS